MRAYELWFHLHRTKVDGYLISSHLYRTSSDAPQLWFDAYGFSSDKDGTKIHKHRNSSDEDEIWLCVPPLWMFAFILGVSRWESDPLWAWAISLGIGFNPLWATPISPSERGRPVRDLAPRALPQTRLEVTASSSPLGGGDGRSPEGVKPDAKGDGPSPEGVKPDAKGDGPSPEGV